MRINTHAHIFTFRSVFTNETLAILVNRLSREQWPDFLVEATESALRKLLNSDYFDEQMLLSELVGKLNASDKLKAWLTQLGSAVPGDVHLLAYGNVNGILSDAALDLMHKLGSLLSHDNDVGNENIEDLIAFLLIGIKHSIREVAEELLTLSGPETVSTALMMDITDGSANDEAIFQGQLNDTSLAALAFPGRILPFVAVNTQRAKHFEHMVEALETKGFVGVKLYPSLGYAVDAPAMDAVYRYCETNDVPILLHCNRGGFAATTGTIQYCDPAHWEPVLSAHPSLRVCFAHFGGDDALIQTPLGAPSWTATILSLMERYPQVYADISYHTACMDGGDAQTNYFANLARLLANPSYRDRILFGSDFLLVRQRVREDNLWRYFAGHFAPDDWETITRRNPARFLGLTGGAGAGLQSLGEIPNTEGGPRNNIVAHLRWLQARNTTVGQIPADWVLELTAKLIAPDVKWFPNPFGPAWVKTNQAHLYTAIWLNGNLRPDRSANNDFTTVGGRLVRDLRDYPVESRPAEERAAKFRGLASDLYIFLCTPQPQGGGAVLEANIQQADAKECLANVFRDGDLELYHLGAAVDRLLRFKAENTLAT